MSRRISTSTIQDSFSLHPLALSLSTAIREARRSFSGIVAIKGAGQHDPMALNPSLSASLLVLTLLQAPGEQAIEPLETKWRESIEADLRNGDPTGQVCTKLGLRHRPAHLPAGCRRRQSTTTATPGRRRHQTLNQRSPPATYTWGSPLLSAQGARIIAGGRRLRISTGACVMSFN